MARALQSLEGLGFDADPQRALAYLAAYEPPDEDQARTRDAIARWVLEEPTPFERANLAGHLTASALVVAPHPSGGRRALLTHHRKLGRWLQLGGHCDGDADLAHVALREAIEESGIEDLATFGSVRPAVRLHAAVPVRSPRGDPTARWLLVEDRDLRQRGGEQRASGYRDRVRIRAQDRTFVLEERSGS